ncbi:MAG: UDP-N-acetylglucosamine 2-epimerase (non-hydrolyzing) [Victivallaceae bacterium]|nr:UDP-N-acetylglucosamine 2-epimerase (non-hydrolyzing) [Victivallaceae bacterium]
MKNILVVFGTRPEVIKMAPVVRALRGRPGDFNVRTCSSGQHREMLEQAMGFFDLEADFCFDVMTPEQSLADETGKILKGMEQVFSKWRPDVVLVQGDTTTVMAAALAAFYHGIEVGHVEAGLRTGNRRSPWPEEMNRQLASRLATIHFAPTEAARENLLREAVDPETVHVTGNTVIDALFEAVRIIDGDSGLQRRLEGKFDFLDPAMKLVLVTGHRRESFGEGLRNICHAIEYIAHRGDVQLVYPVHMNPNVRGPVGKMLGHCRNVFLIEPQDYPSFVHLMKRSHLVLTDSGGVQEEAPSLGKPVVVTRDITERPEAVAAGTVVVAGTDYGNICRHVSRLLDDPAAYQAMARAINPYGDGMASQRIAGILAGKGIEP